MREPRLSASVVKNVSETGTNPNKEDDMARLIVLYRQPTDEAAFQRHYFETHVPLVQKIPGLRSYEVSEGPVAAPGGASNTFLVAMLEFDSMAALQQGMGSAEGQAAVADLPNFAGAGVDIMMCDTRRL
jgi:uncharacterized protein (TIGR02118 family)